MADRSMICELCASEDGVSLVELPVSDGSEDQSVYLCANCKSQIQSGELDPTTAFMMGKLKIEGNMGLAMKIQGMMG